MKPEDKNKKDNTLYSTIEKINDHVYYAYLRIPDFIERSLKEYIPSDYRTVKSIDFTTNETVLRFCTTAELERIAGARALKRQIEWLCGRVVLKDLLLSVMFPGYDYRDIVIGYDSYGRPCIRGHESTGISVTHSGDVAMAALYTVPGKRIGIDVEKISPDMDMILSVAFSPEERQILKNQPVENIVFAFTMKEAYLKVTGQGFHEVITKVSVKDGKIFYKTIEVTGINSITKNYNGQYIVSLIYDL